MPKNKILVLNPPTGTTKNVVRDVLYGCWCAGKRIGGGTVPPFALLEVASVLKQDNNEVTFLDAQAEQRSIADIQSIITDYDVVIILTSTMSFTEDTGNLMKFKLLKPGLTSIVFGSHPTFMPHYCLTQSGVDIVVRHEPEYIIRDVIREMRNGSEGWKSVRGIGFRQNGEFVLNPEYPFIDLEQLPFPDVTMLPSSIHYYNPIVRRMPYITTITSRGCPGKCSFCTAPYFDGEKIRFQSADYVIRTMDYFLAHGYREIYFRDDTFFVWKKRDMEICRTIIDRKLDITWIANARINMIDREMMKMALDAGCHTIKFGVESGDQAILNKINKGYKIEQAYKVFQWAHEVGINTHAHVMLGNPDDTPETINKTIEFVKQLDPTTATFGICTPYPGTPLFEEVAKKFPDIADGSASDLSNLHIEGLFNEHFTSLTREQLRFFVKKAYRTFYWRPSYWIKILQQLRDIDDVKRVSIAAANVIDFSLRGKA